MNDETLDAPQEPQSAEAILEVYYAYLERLNEEAAERGRQEREARSRRDAEVDRLLAEMGW